MNYFIYFTFAGLGILTLLMAIYFVKPRIKNRDNEIYSWLLITTFVGCIVEISMLFTSKIMVNFPLLNTISSKGFLIICEIWLFILTLYTLLVSYENDKKINLKSRIFLILFITSISVVLTIFLPIYYYFDTGHESYSYTYGPSVKTVLYMAIILIIFNIVVIIKRKKYLRIKKLLPIITYIFLAIIDSFLQQIEPSFVVLSYIEVIIVVLMYFTIENPDMKMIQQLNIARDQADKANNAKSEFLSSMSHEIRTPLNAIVGFSQALAEEDIPDSAKEEVKDIISASESLLELVNGILDISKIEANKLEIINNDYRPKEMLHDLVALTKARMGDKNLDLRVNFDETLPDVLYGDKTRVKQIILNLLTNSVKYTKEGFIEFKVSSVIKDDICRLIVSVEDSGIGIKRENIEKLFTKFERLDEQDNVTIEGTGLGLAITKRLVELMNGTIVVQSDYGVGSKFTVSIDQRIVKVKEENVEVKEVVNEVSYTDFSDKRILLVDDNTLNIKVAERLLKNYNVNVKSVTSGFEVIDLINNGEAFDLILMDDMMPKLSGVETFKKLKENSNFSIPTVILTANAIEGMKEKYLSEGFDDYLSKPIVKDELNRVLNKFFKEPK